MATTGESKMTTSNQTQNTERKIIDLSKPDDKEVIMIGAFELSNIASDIYGAMETLGDLSSVLNLIHRGTVDHSQAKHLASLSHECVSTWENILLELMRKLNPTLKNTDFNGFEL